MSTVQLIIGIILIVFSVFLIVAVLMQEGKSKNLSGAIAGGADTFFGKQKGSTVSKTLSTVTSIVAIVFVLLVCTVYVMQDTGSASEYSSFWSMLTGNKDAKTEEVADTTAAEEEETTASEAEDTTAAEAEDTTAAAE